MSTGELGKGCVVATVFVMPVDLPACPFLSKGKSSRTSFRRRDPPWNTLSALSLLSVYHRADVERAILKLGKNAAAAEEILITWLLGFELREYFLSSALRRDGSRVWHYFLSGEKKMTQRH